MERLAARHSCCRARVLRGLRQRRDGAGGSTRARVTNLRDYFKLPSVQHYLIVWPDETRIVRHSRAPNGKVATRFCAGGIRLDPPGITLTVDEFYTD